jgi:hypothetical protein
MHKSIELGTFEYPIEEIKFGIIQHVAKGWRWLLFTRYKRESYTWGESLVAEDLIYHPNLCSGKGRNP